MNNVYCIVKQIISKQLGINEKKILITSKLSEDLGADSLDIIELIMTLEKKFSIEIPDEKIEKIKSVKNIVSHITNIIHK